MDPLFVRQNSANTIALEKQAEKLRYMKQTTTLDNTNYIYAGPNDDLTSTEMKMDDKSADESSYIRGTEKPFVVVPHSK